MNNLIVCNTVVKEDLENRYCLNDLHKASGGNPKDLPSEWLRNKQTKELIREILVTGNPVLEQNQVLSVINGGNKQGVYAIKDLVYAYAMWISAKFQVQVIRAYDDMVNGNPYIKASRKELLKLAYEHEEKIEMLKEQVEYLEPFKEKVDNSKVIFPKKESVYDMERGFKKDVKSICPFLNNDKITSVLQYYTTKKYKDTDYYVKEEIKECVRMFIEDSEMEVSDSKISVILYHDCLLGGKTVVNKAYAIQYLGKCEEDFE